MFTLVLFLFLSGGANSSRIAESRQREEKKEDKKKLAFSYDTNDNKRVALSARFLEDDQLDSQEECMRDAFFSIFNQHHHHGGGRRFKGSEEDIFCEHLVQAKDKDALKCLVAVNAVSCRLERSKVKSRLGKCNKKRFDGGCERCALKRIGGSDDDDDDDDDGGGDGEEANNSNGLKGLFKFLFYDDEEEEDDDNENNADGMDEEEDEEEDKTTSRNFFSVTKATELNMYFQALSRVESECAQHEQRFRALRASRELSEFFKRIELSELEAKKSVEKSMERLRAMEFQIKSSVHETLLETQNVHNQTRERLNLTLTRVQEAQNAVEKLTAFAKVHSMRLKELAITFNRMRDALSKSSLVFFFFVWWFVFGTSFVPHALRTFLRESLRQILGAVLCSHAIEIALVPRFVEYYYRQQYQIKETAEEEREEDIDIELLIAQATQLVRVTVATTVAVRSIRTTMLKNKREKSRLLEQEAFARSLRRVETDVRALLAERRGREEEEEEEEEEGKRGRRGRVVFKALLPPSRRREDESDSDDEEISEKTKKTKKKVNTFNEDFEELKISRLTVYPLKSCKGIDVKRARLTATGFEWDRCFCVIDKDGEFISQRTVPELALVETEFRGSIFEEEEGDDFDENSTMERVMKEDVNDDGVNDVNETESMLGNAKLILRSPNCAEECEIPLLARKEDMSGEVECSVWDYCGVHLAESDAVNEWISRAIRVPGAKIVRWIGTGGIPERFNKYVSTSDRNSRPKRPLDERYAKNGGETAFSDGYPVLLAHESSLDDLQKRVVMGKELFNLAGSEVKMNRFRPNVVVSGGKEWAEDKWLKIETRARKSKSGGGGGGERGGDEGGVSWDLVKPCSRCTIPDINQETGIFDKNREVSRALQKFRSGTVLNSQTKSWANEVFFGWNMITNAPGGGCSKISVGDVVTAKELRPNLSGGGGFM
ncbi:unnamed protein product [Bathycoccus prasinos]